MKKFLKSLELRLSDLFLLIGFIPFAFFIVNGQVFMQHQDPSEVNFPLWAIMLCLAVMIPSWAIYLFLELKVNKVKFNKVIPIIFLILLIINIVAIWVQPGNFVETVMVKEDSWFNPPVGTYVDIQEHISIIHKLMFTGEVIGVAMFIYIALFVFSKRIKSVKFIEFLGYLLFIGIGVMLIYSYIVERDCYLASLKWLLGLDRTINIAVLNYQYAVKSFIINKNAFGMMCMLGIIFCFINHSIKKRVWYYPLVGFFFINMIFSYCKTGFLLTIIVITIYVIYQLFTTYKIHPKVNRIIAVLLGIVLVITIIFLSIPRLRDNSIVGRLFEMVYSLFVDSKTMNSRVHVWENCIQLLNEGWWAIGRGFGTLNLMLMPMNIITHHDFVFPTHSSFMNMLSVGGIPLLVGYIAFIVYCAYVMIKSYKKSPAFVFAISLGVICFFLYSFIETIQYLIYVFLFPIFIIYFQEKKN